MKAAMKVEIVEDPADPRVADYRDARDGQLRNRAGLLLGEGRLVVRRLLEASRFRVRSLLLTPRALDDLRDLLARDESPPVYLTSAETIRAVVGFKFHRGCLAAAERGAPLDPTALIAPPGARTLLALEELTDPDNVGAVFRNAAAFGAAGVLLSPGCADPLYRKAIRVAMGATLSLPFARIDWRDGLDRLRAAGYTRLALTPDHDAEDISTLVAGGLPSRRLALLVGAEGRGLGAGTRRTAERRVRIPMAADADSLNVATACGIALHRLA